MSTTIGSGVNILRVRVNALPMEEVLDEIVHVHNVVLWVDSCVETELRSGCRGSVATMKRPGAMKMALCILEYNQT